MNKSDSEKVLARKLGVGAEELERMVTARGREVSRELIFRMYYTGAQVARLEAALESRREQGEVELRKTRHQLALAQAEAHQAKQEGGQLKQALEDQRRENQILTEEVLQQNSKLDALNSERAGLEGDLEGSKAVLEQVKRLKELNSHIVKFQLQRQLTELQSSDTVLRARQQHDATVRSLMERFLILFRF